MLPYQTPSDWMALAVEESKRSINEERNSPVPKVGAVIVKDNVLLGTAYRGKAGPGCHAEYSLINELKQSGISIEGADVYTTLEPCSRRSPDKIPCAQRLAAANVRAVWIGMYDPNPQIKREGWKILHNAGVILKDFEPPFREEIIALNTQFFRPFNESVDPDNFTAKFDFKTNNNGQFPITVGHYTFNTQWSSCSENSVYAYDNQNNVGHVKHAKSFDDIDDPSAQDWTNRAVEVEEGQVVIYRSNNHKNFLLVQVIKVDDVKRGAEYNQLEICWEYR